MVIGRVCLDGGGAGERACPLRASPQSESAADPGPMARRVAGDHPAHAQAKTFENSTSLVRTHCGPLRSRPLARLAVRDIDDLLFRVAERFPQSAVVLHRILRSALNTAFKRGLMVANPCTHAVVPRVREVERGTRLGTSKSAGLRRLDER